MKITGVLLLFIVLIFSCKTTDQGYENHFEKKWDGGTITYIQNASKTLVLAQRQSPQNSTTVDYSVYELATNNELFKSGFIGSSVEWYSDNEIIIKGTSRVQNGKDRIINVLTGKSQTN